MKNSKILPIKKPLVLIITLCLCIGASLPIRAMTHFTEDEQNYLLKKTRLRAASIDGGAPLHYRDAEGKIKGIAVQVLNEIASITGLTIEYELYDSIDDVIKSDADILFGMTKEYAPTGIILSKPYLKSETILFYNSSLDPNELEDKKYAAIRGGTLPEGIGEENTIYFNNREDTFKAVDSGEADYGFGNAYSLAFYTLQNGYKNLITVPKGKEERKYCMGVRAGNEDLLFVIDKAIDGIDENRMQTLILNVASQVERKITLSMVADAYGKEIAGIILLIITILLFSVFFNVRANNRLKMENRKYHLLSYISNECLFEYDIKSDLLKPSEEFSKTIDIYKKKNAVTNLIKDALDTLNDNNIKENISTIKLPLTNGDHGIFKIVYSNIYDENKKLYSVIGKLIDISKEVEEKEKLIFKSQLDGLTRLYNATTTENLVKDSIKNKNEGTTDAFMIIDCDNFKDINDTYGHLRGNLVLENISKALRLTFRQTDIIGRIGGDEFCVYMHNIPSTSFVRLKCRQLVNLIRELNKDLKIAVSIGISILDKKSTYEDLFKQADDALYIAKNSGKGQFIVYGEEML